LRLKDLLGPATRVKKKERIPCSVVSFEGDFDEPIDKGIKDPDKQPNKRALPSATHR
jgi:hypothetical protein